MLTRTQEVVRGGRQPGGRQPGRKTPETSLGPGTHTRRFCLPSRLKMTEIVPITQDRAAHEAAAESEP